MNAKVGGDFKGEQAAIWNRLLRKPDSERWLDITMGQVAHGLSDMVGQTVLKGIPRVEKVPIAQVATRAGDPEIETVGIYLQMETDLSGWAALILPLTDALNLVDLVADSPLGTAVSLGPVERSVLGEVGNLMVSFFLNAVASLSKTPEPLRPSPPAVVVDMLGTILNLMVTPVAARSDDLLIVETIFEDVARTVQVRFWVSPDPSVY